MSLLLLSFKINWSKSSINEEKGLPIDVAGVAGVKTGCDIFFLS